MKMIIKRKQKAFEVMIQFTLKGWLVFKSAEMIAKSNRAIGQKWLKNTKKILKTNINI